MGSSFGVGELGILAVVCALGWLLVVVARRLWLNLGGGIAECALRHGDGRWMHGLARYRGNRFEWFGRWGLLPRPSFVLRRRHARVVTWREADEAESRLGFQISRVLVVVRDDEPGEWSLAMNHGSATGLVSWLESAPPGTEGYRPDLG